MHTKLKMLSYYLSNWRTADYETEKPALLATLSAMQISNFPLALHPFKPIKQKTSWITSLPRNAKSETLASPVKERSSHALS